VLFYNIDAAPKLDAEFVKRGGLRAGTPGVVEGEPLKLFAIRGAGTDAEGNLYVALGKNMSIIRKFNRKKDLVWEVQSLFFVDATSVLPSSDGGEIYGREEIFTFDYKAPPAREPGNSGPSRPTSTGNPMTPARIPPAWAECGSWTATACCS